MFYTVSFLSEIKLYKVEDEDVTEVSGTPLNQEMLESDVFFAFFCCIINNCFSI